MSPIVFDYLAYPPVGRWLKAQRDILGLSISAASDIAQMSENTLSSLESEQFLSLPEPIFVRGYLRRYAKALQLDPMEVIALYDAWLETYALTNNLIDYQATPTLVTAPADSWVTRLKDTLDTVLHYSHSKVGQTVLTSFFIGAFAFFLSVGSNSNQATRTAQFAKYPSANLSTTAFYPSASKLPEKKFSGTAEVKVAGEKANYLIASSTTHVQVIDASGLIVYHGLVRPSIKIQLNGQMPFKLNAERLNTVKIISYNDDSTELLASVNI